MARVLAQPTAWGFVWIAGGAAMQLAGAIGVGLFAGAVRLSAPRAV